MCVGFGRVGTTSRSALCGVLAEVDGNAAFVGVVEHGNQLQARAERFEVVPQRRDAHIVSVLELGDRGLGDAQASHHLDLTERLGPPKLVQPDLLECLLAPLRGALGVPGAVLQVASDLCPFAMSRRQTGLLVSARSGSRHKDRRRSESPTDTRPSECPVLSPPSSTITCRRGSNMHNTRSAPSRLVRSSFVLW